MNRSPSLHSDKITARHLDRAAIVYVRQSTLQQVLDHQESTRLQYGLVDRALAFGWMRAHIQVIDDDLGKSATSIEGRVGFQHLVAEVGLGRVGLILGIDMSRLARSCKDWHQLLEICALFGTLIADLDGVYDPSLFNDRLLLGLKGTMSEAESHILKQRLLQGTRNKAQRGELRFRLPTGYVHTPSGDIAFDPDEQVQQVIHLIFRKFEELGSVNALLRFLVQQKIQLGMRRVKGDCKGQLEWHAPHRATLQCLLKHPIYAGAYTYGRRQTDPRKQQPGKPATGRIFLPEDEWHVLIPDALPAYISWEQYQRNLAQLKANQSLMDQLGAPRSGPALLAGLLVCGSCGSRLAVSYPRTTQDHYTYICCRQASEYGQPRCQRLVGNSLDHWVTQQVFEVLQPAAIDLAIAAATTIQQDRAQLHRLWQQRLERAAFEADRAARHYQLLEPENRLVARQLAQDWEAKLNQQQDLQQDYEQFCKQQPKQLNLDELNAIRQLATQIPQLWHAPTTTPEHRKEILRQIIRRVTVQVQGKTELVHVSIEWNSGDRSDGIITRPVAKFSQLSYYLQLCDCIRQLHAQQLSYQEIANHLNQLGFRPPKRCQTFNEKMVTQLVRQLGLSQPLTQLNDHNQLQKDEWFLSRLANTIDMPVVTLYHWLKRGWLSARQETAHPRRWIVWADSAELQRLKHLAHQPQSHAQHQRWKQKRDAHLASKDLHAPVPST